ncbi:ROK family protein [Microvirga sp. SRT01]|uniref:fructokinase n=1 Tax=Sphingomonas longa TaxID=2778730 RepID=A0ABS2DB93_9SPHN|nr:MULTISPECIES: ROK family protein [Alphaproteobacteria]MBM6578207.1 ROK family protein [Sphingomonas sp. BT552]MBR7711248.1 ROK family protein [Microvirga sp. SRT01]
MGPDTQHRHPFAGIELGGTKCVCTLAHGPGEIVDQRTIPTTLPAETLAAILTTLRDWDAAHGFAAVGIASFGPVCLDHADHRYGHILATNKPGWRDTDIVGPIAAAVDRPVGFDTDVNGAALAEMRWGCAQGLHDFAYVTVGTGVGVGLIVHGKPTRGIGHSEIGHIRVPRLPDDSVASACIYHDDCVEGLASGSALVVRLKGRAVADVAADDPVWDPVVATLAAMCHSLVATTGPLRIAIGGGVLNRQPHLLPRIEAALERSLGGYMDLPDTRPFITAPALGDLAGPLGSIVLAANAL